MTNIDTNHATSALSNSDLKEILGTDWDNTKASIVCSNGDAEAQNNIYSILSSWNGSTKTMNLMFLTSSNISGNVRINYTILAND